MFRGLSNLFRLIPVSSLTLLAAALQTDESRTPCRGNGIQYQGDLNCICHACWSVGALCQALGRRCCWTWEAAVELLGSLQSILSINFCLWQGSDCSVQEDLNTCVVNAESGSPLLFGATKSFSHSDLGTFLDGIILMFVCSSPIACIHSTPLAIVLLPVPTFFSETTRSAQQSKCL